MAVAASKGSLLVRIARKLSGRVALRARSALRPLTGNEKAFMAWNERYWREHFEQRPVEDQYVMVHHELYPLALLGNVHIASLVARAKSARLLLLAPSRFDRPANSVLKSFPNVHLEYESSLAGIFHRVKGFFSAYMALRHIKTPEQLLNFTHDGLLIGDNIYDTLLSCGHATIRSIEPAVLLPMLAQYYYRRSMMDRMTRKYRIVAGLATHIVGVPGATFVRSLLLKGTEIYIRETTLKKYSSLAMMHECCATPDKRYIEFMRTKPEQFVPLGEQAMEERIGNRTSAGVLAYQSDKVIYTSRVDFARAYRLDPDKKNVFVMLHAFNDYPHTYGNFVHKDFYEWFMHVLELAQKNTDVNWIFKNHPYAKYYPTDVDVDAVFDSVDRPNIVYLKESEKFNTSSLRYLADAVITCLGTAGLEYSAYGVPCILAARCWYSGLGFTREPQGREEYERELMQIGEIERLTPQQVEIAKIMAYFSFKVMDQTQFADPFRTIATYDMDEARSSSSDEMIGMILQYRDSSTADEKQAYTRAICDFISNTRWTQYVDFVVHPKLQEAIL